MEPNPKFNIGFVSSHGHAVEGHILDLAANHELESIHLCVLSELDAVGRKLDVNVAGSATEKVKTKTTKLGSVMAIEVFAVRGCRELP